MKSIQSKFLIIIISGMLILAMAITFISLFYIGRVLNNDSDIITESVADTETLRINHYLKDIEYLVMTMENYAAIKLTGRSHILKDEKLRNNYEEAAANAVRAAMENIDGIMAFYLRLAPECVEDEYAGFYECKVTEKAIKFVEKEPENVKGWDGEWYSLAMERGAPIWLAPYDCENTAVEIISYVNPIYVDNTFIGVVGVDVGFSKITDMVGNISVYDNGFAYLAGTEYENTVFFTPDEHLLERAEKHDHEFAEERKELDNGMTLIIHADYSDIQRDSYRMTMLIIAIVVIILAGFIVITFALTKKIVRPLREITSAAEMLADGRTDLRLDGCKTQDEVGVLATAFEKTAEKLGGYMNYINALAYKDSLTGVKNRTAYNEIVTELDLAMEIGDCEPFAVLVADINGLKKTNDRYGHEIGNKLIIKAAKIICDVFKHSPVCRIGGDEFVVVLRGQDFDRRKELLKIMDDNNKSTSIMVGEETIPVTVARAMEDFDLGLDSSFEDVFNRADKKMYEHKNSMR